MCYSGGKDSTYTSIILKNEYKLNILAITFDNGFVSGYTKPFDGKSITSVGNLIGVLIILF